jgi:hypothetical protein
MSESRREPWLCLGLSAAVTLLVAGPVLFSGRTFVPTDFLATNYPWGGRHATDAFVRNRMHQDILEFDAAHAVAAHASLREGSLLLWNPYILCGVPSVGDPQLGTFYPPRILLFLCFPPFRGLDLLIVLHLLAAGPAMYLFARTWGLKPPAALTAGLVWMLCGAQMAWLKYSGAGAAAVGLPLMAAALRRGLAGPSALWVAASGALWALLFLGAHPHLSFFGLVWVLVSLAAAVRPLGWARIWKAGALFGAVGAGLAAVQLLPFLASLSASQKTAVQENLIYSRPTRTPLLLATLVWQRAFGSPIDRVDLVPRLTGSNFFDFQGYMGLLPLALALAAWRRSRLLWGLVLVTLALATCYPLWWLLRTLLPPLSVVDPHRLYLLSFAMALLAGLGHEVLLERPPRRLAALAGAAAGLVLAVGLAGAAAGASWISLANPAYAALALASAACAAALAALRTGWDPRVKTAAVWIAVVADLLPGFAAYNPSYEPPLPEPELIARLPRDERVLADLKSAYFEIGVSNYLMMYGCSTPSGYVSQYPRITLEFSEALGGRATDHGVDWSRADERALRMLNVSRVVTRDGERRLDPLPRAWLVGRVEVVSDRDARLRRLRDASFDPSVSALVEMEVPGLGGASGGRVERVGRDEYVVDVESPGVLTTSEVFDSGWICEVDGARRPVLRVNHAMRGVKLEEGRHRVVFRYRPWTVVWGGACSIATLALGGAFALIALRRRRRIGASS